MEEASLGTLVKRLSNDSPAFESHDIILGSFFTVSNTI